MTANAEEFARVYEDHVWDVYGFFGYRLNSREQCEDLTQQTFEKALKAWKKFDPERASARTWLLAIAHNLLIDFYRKLGTAKEILVDDLPEESARAGPAHSLEVNIGLDPELETALDALTDRERELIALRFGGDLAGPEIAEVTDLSVDNVHQILSRSLRKLRDALEAAQPDPSALGDAPLSNRSRG